jgi:renalase
MTLQTLDVHSSLATRRAPTRVAVIGAGIAGLSCARELALRGCGPVVFEASGRLGGRCSSRTTRVGVFDDAAQCITGATRLASYVRPEADAFAPLHAWTVPASPAEDEPAGRLRDRFQNETDVTRTLKLMGAVGVPSMRALADAVAQPLDVRLDTPIQNARRRGAHWVLQSAEGEIDEDFQALVLAIPAPLAAPLACESQPLAAALREVRYRSRWVLLLGTERAVNLPGYREFEGSPIERVAAMHSKPGRPMQMPQRWFLEADAHWSLQHAHHDAEAVADLLLDNFRAHAGRAIHPNFLCAHQWQYAFVESHGVRPTAADCWWDGTQRMGVCGDSVVASRVDRVHASGVSLAKKVAASLADRGARVDLGMSSRGRESTSMVHA